MKVSWDKIGRAAFATAAAAALWASASFASAAAAREPADREGDGDDGILGEGAGPAIDPSVIQVDDASGGGAVGDYLQNLVATWEKVTGQPLCVEVTVADPADAQAGPVVAPHAAPSDDAVVEVSTDALTETPTPLAEATPLEIFEATDVAPAAEPSELAAPAESIEDAGELPAEAASLDADVIVERGGAAESSQGLAGEWTLPRAEATSFEFTEADAVPEEAEALDATPAEAQPEAVTAPATTPDAAAPELTVPEIIPADNVVAQSDSAEGDDDITTAVAELDASELDRSAIEPLTTFGPIELESVTTTDAPDATTPEPLATEPTAAASDADTDIELPELSTPPATADEGATQTEPEESAGLDEAADAGSVNLLAAAGWLQTVLERYHSQPLETSAVRPLYCQLSECTNWPGAAEQFAGLVRRQRDADAGDVLVAESLNVTDGAEVPAAAADPVQDAAVAAEEAFGF